MEIMEIILWLLESLYKCRIIIMNFMELSGNIGYYLLEFTGTLLNYCSKMLNS